VIAAYEALNSEENSGTGTEVLYAWLGEAQFGSGKYDQALKSFKKSEEQLQAEGGNDDAICGIMTAYVRMGDAFLKLGRLGEAQAAYKTALSKYDAGAAIKRANFPALLPLAAAHAGLGELNFTTASTTKDTARQDALRKRGCDELAAMIEINKVIPVAFSFSPANFPAFERNAASQLQECNPALVP
jgi:tetratricopeptide (TPR) repeat protein